MKGSRELARAAFFFFASAVSRPFLATFGAVGIALMAAMANVQAQYNFTTLSVPGATVTEACGIQGDIVVGSYDIGSNEYGFLYSVSTGVYTTGLGVPGATKTSFYGIDGNDVVGSYGAPTAEMGFVYDISTGTFTTGLSVAGADFTYAEGISGGNVVGYSTDEIDPDLSDTGFVYNINSGVYSSLSDPAGISTRALGINGNNIVGDYSASGGTSGVYGFLYNGGVYTELAVPGAQSTYACGISGGNLVGYDASFDPVDSGTLGFLYNTDTGAYTSLKVAGSTATRALGIDGNSIVGDYTRGLDTYGFLATPVPEPSPLALSATAIFLFFLFSCHRSFLSLTRR